MQTIVDCAVVSVTAGGMLSSLLAPASLLAIQQLVGLFTELIKNS